MKKLLVVSFYLLFVFLLPSAGQKGEKATVKFGKITPEDFKQVYSIDSNAQAIVIADIGYSSFAGNHDGWFTLQFERQLRIHILNKGAYDLASFIVPLFSSENGEEELLNLKGTTYNLDNGKITEAKLDKDDVFKDKVDKNWVVKKFTLPDVHEGSIIEVSYKIKSDFLRNLQPWTFQGDYPVLWSEYKVALPSFFSYIILTQGYKKFDIEDKKEHMENFAGTTTSGGGVATRFTFSANVTDFRWVMKNMLPLKQEAFTSTLKNYIAKIEFQMNAHLAPLAQRSIMGTWEELDEELTNSEVFGLQIQADRFLFADEIPKQIRLVKEPTLEKAKIIYEYVRDNFTCTDHSSLFLSQNLRNLFKTKNGNVADINLAMVGLLRSSGFEADPVILGLKSRGITYDKYPLLDKFNYVIARLKVDGKYFYLDATDPVLGFGKLDPLCYNGHAMVINGEPEAIQLNADTLNEKKATSVFITYENGKFKGTLQQALGYAQSSELRTSVKESNMESVEAGIKKEFNSEVEFQNFKIDSLNKKDEPVGISYNFSIGTDNEDIIYLNPLFCEGYRNNPFKSAQRLYPVEMPYTVDEVYTLTLNVPQGYSVDEMPKSIVVKLNEKDEGLFEYRISQSTSTISLRCRLQIKRTLFEPEEYDLLREFFNMVVAKQNEQIVFKKTSN